MNIAVYMILLMAISLNFKMISSYAISEENNSEKEDLNINRSMTWNTGYDWTRKTAIADGCKCEGGTCVKDRSGKLVCKCPPEYGVYESPGSVSCKKCDCGKGANCTFTGLWNTKTCICKDGYAVVSGKCKDISSTSKTTENATRISLRTTITVVNDSSSATDGTAIDVTTSNDHLLTNVTVPTNTNSAITETTTMAATTHSDLCTENPCKNGGICQMESGQVKCYCKSPFTGEFCENDPCANNLCRNGGTCRVRNTTFYCNCDAPFFGEFCERDPCSENPCQNGGSCFIRRNTFICDCKKPYIGNTCEIDSTKCLKLIIIAVLATSVTFLIVYSICLSARKFKR